jgi:hypothetical protein
VRGVAIDSEESARAAARSNWLGTLGSRSRFRRLAPPVCLVALAVTAWVPAALAAEPLSGYGGTTTAPATTPSREPPHEQPRPNAKEEKPQPETSQSPSEEVPRPEEKDERPVVAATVATKRASPARALPFTGHDVRTELALGLLLIAGGCALLLVQRRGMSARRVRHTRIARLGTGRGEAGRGPLTPGERME